jgi:hypothetical protein
MLPATQATQKYKPFCWILLFAVAVSLFEGFF